jgi:C1A family cysteine protease
MVQKIKRYGWVPDLPDVRDHMFAAPAAVMTALPPKVDLSGDFPDIYNQGDLGSCSGNAIAAAIQFERLKQNLTPDFIPSRLFIYYNERVLENTVMHDAGAQIRDGIKSVAQQGVCPEDEWDYDETQFTQAPPDSAYTDAKDHIVTSYSRVTQTLSQLKGCLASGKPFVFGFTVYDGFESDAVAQTGVLQLPQSGEKLVGGHAVVGVGYDDSTQRFLVRNSWGPDWGQSGYFTMPYAYLTDDNLAADIWEIKLVAD